MLLGCCLSEIQSILDTPFRAIILCDWECGMNTLCKNTIYRFPFRIGTTFNRNQKKWKAGNFLLITTRSIPKGSVNLPRHALLFDWLNGTTLPNMLPQICSQVYNCRFPSHPWTGLLCGNVNPTSATFGTRKWEWSNTFSLHPNQSSSYQRLFLLLGFQKVAPHPCTISSAVQESNHSTIVAVEMFRITGRKLNFRKGSLGVVVVVVLYCLFILLPLRSPAASLISWLSVFCKTSKRRKQC